ncbi:MAG: hypothetical protein U5K74_08880 [Gemmatimonadaceae bacterium]|nr:hypothetical protein [Gemmatimonadaceae bacterium]
MKRWPATTGYRVTVANMQLGGIWEKVMPGALRHVISGASGDEAAAGHPREAARTFLARPARPRFDVLRQLRCLLHRIG